MIHNVVMSFVVGVCLFSTFINTILNNVVVYFVTSACYTMCHKSAAGNA